MNATRANTEADAPLHELDFNHDSGKVVARHREGADVAHVVIAEDFIGLQMDDEHVKVHVDARNGLTHVDALGDRRLAFDRRGLWLVVRAVPDDDSEDAAGDAATASVDA